MRKKLFTSLEEFEVDKAIKAADVAVPDNATELLELVENKIKEDNQSRVEDVPPGDDVVPTETTQVAPVATDEESQEIVETDLAVEALFTVVNRGMDSVMTLESIADILQDGQDSTGITPANYGVIVASIESIYGQVGVQSKTLGKVNTVSLEAMSIRLKVANETINEIKDKIVAIWRAIVARIKQIYKFLVDRVNIRKIQNKKYQADLGKLTSAFVKYSDKMDKPTNVDILGPSFTTLIVSGNLSKFSDIEKVSTQTLTVISEFIKEISKSSKETQNNIKQIKDLLFSISANFTELSDTGGITVKADAVKGILLTDPMIKAPTFTTRTGSAVSKDYDYTGKMLAGGFQYAYSGLKTTEWTVYDLSNIKLVLLDTNVSDDKQADSIAVIDKSEFQTAFTLIGNAIKVQDDLIELSQDVIKSLESFIDYSEKLQKNSQIANNAKLQDNPLSQQAHSAIKQVNMFKLVTDASNSFYLKSVTATDTYLDSYIKQFLRYTEHSLKEYL